jgi:NADPH-dependent 2,4-dienoyl-CoA reductase/sulfur reductase-like enzyme
MRLVVVGSGAAGDAAAFEARRIDPSLSVSLFSEEGLPLYSPCLLPQYVGSFLSRDKLFLRTLDDYRRAGIEFVHGRVIEIKLQDRKILTESGSLGFDKAILALGSRPRDLPMEGMNRTGVLSLKNLKDGEAILRHLAARVAVIGSGNIGIEASLALRTRGCKVTLFEAEATVNPLFFPPSFSNLIQKSLESEGVEVITGARITEISGETHVEGLIDRGKSQLFDVIINCTGMIPNAEMAMEAGLAIGSRGGILIDSSMRTSDPSIYACGDCVEVHDDEEGRESILGALWPNAILQGRAAGSNAAGRPKKQEGLLNLRILRIRDNFAISLGRNEKELASAEDVGVIDTQPFAGVLMRSCFGQGRLIAGRLWGKACRLGPFISCIRSKWEVKTLHSFLRNRRTLLRHPSLGQLPLFFQEQRHPG